MALEKQPLTFISYSRKDKDFALELAKKLKASGFLIWLDQLDIPTGARWDDEIQKALEQCTIFIVILTPSSTASNNVKDEIGYAIDSNKHILPILLENAQAPFRLRRFQYVDFTNISQEEGIDRAIQLLRKLVSELSVSTQESSPVMQNLETQPRADHIVVKLNDDSNELAHKKAEAMQTNHETGHLQRQTQSIPPTQTTANTPLERPIRQQPSLKLLPIIIGISLFCICIAGGWTIWRYTISPISIVLSEIPTTTIPTSEHSLATKIPTNTTAFIEIPPSTTLAPSPAATTITPFAPQQPDQFIIFYFETILYKRDYELAWSLLSTTFKEKNNPDGFEGWKATWEKVVTWERPKMSQEYLTPSQVVVYIPEMTFYSQSKYTLYDRKYCLIRDESRNTWIIEAKEICGL